MPASYRKTSLFLICLSILVGGGYIGSLYLGNNEQITPGRVTNLEKLTHEDKVVAQGTPEGFESAGQYAVLGNLLKFNSNFDQLEVCRVWKTCDIPIFLLRSESGMDFPLTVLDVVEVNAGARVNTRHGKNKVGSAKGAEANIALLGEKAYFAKDEDFGVFKTYLSDLDYKNVSLIREQPLSYTFSLGMAEFADSSNKLLETSNVVGQGYHKKWTLSQSPVRLAAGGKYIVNEIAAEDDSEIIITESKTLKAKPTFIFIEEKIDFIPKLSFENTSSDVVLFVAGANSIQIRHHFRGLLVCPYCAIELDNKSSEFSGQVYARSVRLHPGSSVTHRQYDIINVLTEIGRLTLQGNQEESDYDPRSSVSMPTSGSEVIFDTGNEKIDSMVTDFIKSGGGHGEEQKKQYEKTLLDLQNNAAETAAAIESYYRRLTPSLDVQQYRWKLIQTLGSLNTEHAVSALETVALSNYEAEQFGYVGDNAKRFNADEQMIRIRAVDGLALRAEKGDINAVDALYRIATTRSGAEQSLAIQGYILSGNRDERTENIRRALPDVPLRAVNQGE